MTPKDAPRRLRVNGPGRTPLRARVVEVFRFRDLLYFLALRDVKARYKQAVFGIAWAVVQPLVGVAMFFFVFRSIAGVPSDGIPYATFALCGFVLWSYFSISLNGAVASLVSDSALVTKVYFPRMAAPLAALIPGFVNLAVGGAILAVVMVVQGVAPGWPLVVAPACLAWLLFAGAGPGLLLSALNVKYRDVAGIMTFLVQLWLLASPVAYPASLVSEAWRPLYFLNPMAGIIETARWSLIGGPAPGALALISLATTTILLVVGLSYFERTERDFADVI